MKAITICQPWAWAIMHGPKRIENRSWSTTHRGPLLIHAGKSRNWLGGFGKGEPAAANLVFGCIVGKVDVVDCVRLVEVAGRPFAEGPWCWLLANPVILPEPVPWRGQQGLFDIPESALAPHSGMSRSPAPKSLFS